MLRILFGVFVVLHGFVHLLYLGQSRRLYKLQPEMIWPDGSWAFSGLLDDEVARQLASIFLLLTAGGFLVSGAGLIMDQHWWRPAVLIVGAFSVATFTLFWDRALSDLDDKGVIGIVINLAILGVALWRQGSDFRF